MRDDAIGSTFEIPFPIAMTMAAFLAVALYNVIELNFMIFSTFKRRSGLYFWSMLVATWSIVPYSLGFTFKFFEVMKPSMILVTIAFSGWCFMVTGQSLVLYSRLHLVVRNEKILRWVLYMIILDAIICDVPVGVFAYGSYSANPTPFVALYSIYEKVQVTIFFLQECIISGLYVFETVRILRDSVNIRGTSPHKFMKHLIYMNVFIIVFDLTLLSTEYAGYYNIQTTYKASLYSIKLKIEFRILNQLLDHVKRGQAFWSNQATSNMRSTTANRSDYTYASSDKRKYSTAGISQYQATLDTDSEMGYLAYAQRTKRNTGDIRLPVGKELQVLKETEVSIEHNKREVREKTQEERFEESLHARTISEPLNLSVYPPHEELLFNRRSTGIYCTRSRLESEAGDKKGQTASALTGLAT
jgi:hypothetical protein